MDNLVINSDIKNIIDKTLKNKVREYDCLVMFTGGKDSTYLLWLLKNVYGSKVKALTIDNGFLDPKMVEYSQTICNRLEVEHEIVCSYQKELKQLYRSMFVEADVFNKEYGKNNFFCMICNYLLYCIANEEAEKMNIPMIVSGIDLAQIRADLTSNRIINKAYSMACIKTHELIKMTKMYSQDNSYSKIIDMILLSKHDVTTLFPFLYLDYDVENIKSVIKQNVDWDEKQLLYSDKKYISSGCKLVEALHDIAPLNWIDLNEEEYYKVLRVNKAIDYKYNSRVIKDYISLSSPIFDELGIKKFFEKKCEDQNIRIID